MCEGIGIFSRRSGGVKNARLLPDFLRRWLRAARSSGRCRYLDPGANHDSADNQSKDQVRKSGLGERYEDTTNDCSEIGQCVVLREYPASANMYLARAMLLQKSH